jgi:hypothetical protein
MIKLTENATFTVPVALAVPGVEQPQEARITYRVISRARLREIGILAKVVNANALMRAWVYLKLCWRARRRAGLLDLAAELIESWEGFDLPYSRAALRTLFTQIPGSYISVLAAFFSGLEEGRRKN